ncbi:hypothetical protein Tco_1053401 [Tanacetum coccineum]
MEILPESTSNSSAVGTDNGVTTSFQQSRIHYHMLILKLCQGRFLASFQDDAKYEHVGQDTISQDGKEDKDKQGKDLKISELKTKSKDNDKSSRSKNAKHEGISLQQAKDQDKDSRIQRQSNLNKVQGSKIQDLTPENLKTTH